MASITIATASYDRHIRLWEARTGRSIRQFSFHDSQVNCMALSPDRARLAAGGNPTIRIFDISPTVQPMNQQLAATEEGKHTGNVTAIGFLKSTRGSSSSAGGSTVPLLYSASEDGHLKLWELRPPLMKLRKDVDTKAPITCAAVMPDQSCLLTGSQYGTVSVWPLITPPSESGTRTPSLVSGLQGDNGSSETLYSIQDIPFGDDCPVRCLTVSPQADLLCVGTNNGTIHCLKINRLEWNNMAGSGGAGTAVLPPGRPTSATGSDAGLSPTTPGDSFAGGTPTAAESGLFAEPFHAFQAHQKYVLRCHISPNGKLLVTTSADYTLAVWTIPDATVRYGGSAQVEGSPAVGSPNSNSAASPQSPTANSSSPLTFLSSVPQEGQAPTSAASATGSLAANPPPAWPLLKTLTGHTRWVWDCAFSSCSGYLVSASSDHTGRLWEVESGKAIVSYNHQKPVTCVIVEDRKE